MCLQLHMRACAVSDLWKQASKEPSWCGSYNLAHCAQLLVSCRLNSRIITCCYSRADAAKQTKSAPFYAYLCSNQQHRSAQIKSILGIMNSSLMHSSMRTSARPSMTCSARSLHPAGTAQLLRMPVLTAPSPSPRSTSSSSREGQLRQRQVDCQGLFGLGLPELAVIAGVAALIFGPSKLPELGKGLGKTVKSFQTGLKEFEVELKTATGDDKDATAVGSGSKTEEEKVKTTSDKL